MKTQAPRAAAARDLAAPSTDQPPATGTRLRTPLGRKVVLALAAVLALVIGQLAVPGAANAASSSWYVSWGASFTSGNIAWNDYSAKIGGSLHVPSGYCRSVTFQSSGGYSASRSVCSGNTSFGFTLQGAGLLLSGSYVYVILGGNQDLCYAGATYCVNG